MNNDISISPEKITKAISYGFRKYHIIIFSVLMFIILAGTTLVTYNITMKVDPNDNLGVHDMFDQTTMEKIRNYDNATLPTSPEGRTNPFQ